jgi:hypothetical protein
MTDDVSVSQEQAELSPSPVATTAESAPPAVDRVGELRGQTFGFDGHPLEHFRGLSAEQIQAHPGIGPKYCARILTALAELDELVPPPPPAPVVAEPASEPAASGGSGGLSLLVLVVGLAVVIAVVFLFASGGPGGRAAQYWRDRADEQQATLATIRGENARAASVEAERVQAAAHAGNFGDALERLDAVDQTLSTLLHAASDGRGADETEVGTAPAVTAARDAAAKARAALKLEKPLTKQDVEATCTKLYDAVRSLRPTGEQAHGEAGGQPQH